ncbi:MAG: transcription elongation factor GreA [Acidiferrobacterales bacterium]
MNKVPITADGAKKLRAQLIHLKTVKRRHIIQEIAEARSHGDISENAEFHAAKEQQSFIEGRIAELESMLATAQIIDPATLDTQGRVVFGATLVLLDAHGEQEVTYQIVGDLEADIAEGKISISSPIARALIGKEEGDVVDVEVPDGTRSYEILDVRYV